MGLNDICSTGLGLGLGSGHDKPSTCLQSDHHQQKKKITSLKYDPILPSLTLGPSSDDAYLQSATKMKNHSKVLGDQLSDLQYHHHQQQQQASSISAVSSFSYSSVKKERDGCCDQEADVEDRVSSRVSDEDEDGSPRKKLRLSKEQSAILEDSFKEHSTLNPKQKQALAQQLNLRPRQVEVWFQNRRARTKLKQTEVDCELLKKCCETLTEENKRLQKELQELKSMKVTTPFYMQLPAATLSMCPSCERIASGGSNDVVVSSPTNPFMIGSKPHHFYSPPFTHPSAAF